MIELAPGSRCAVSHSQSHTTPHHPTGRPDRRVAGERGRADRPRARRHRITLRNERCGVPVPLITARSNFGGVNWREQQPPGRSIRGSLRRHRLRRFAGSRGPWSLAHSVRRRPPNAGGSTGSAHGKKGVPTPTTARGPAAARTHALPVTARAPFARPTSSSSSRRRVTGRRPPAA